MGVYQQSGDLIATNIAQYLYNSLQCTPSSILYGVNKNILEINTKIDRNHTLCVKIDFKERVDFLE